MMKNSIKVESIDKIDVEDLIKDFKILNIDNFTLYLKEVWRVMNKIYLIRI
jgi:transposase-like protein